MATQFSEINCEFKNLHVVVGQSLIYVSIIIH